MLFYTTVELSEILTCEFAHIQQLKGLVNSNSNMLICTYKTVQQPEASSYPSPSMLAYMTPLTQLAQQVCPHIVAQSSSINMCCRVQRQQFQILIDGTEGLEITRSTETCSEAYAEPRAEQYADEYAGEHADEPAAVSGIVSTRHFSTLCCLCPFAGPADTVQESLQQKWEGPGTLGLRARMDS